VHAIKIAPANDTAKWRRASRPRRARREPHQASPLSRREPHQLVIVVVRYDASGHGKTNLYAYVMNDPVNRWDPAGLCTSTVTTVVADLPYSSTVVNIQNLNLVQSVDTSFCESGSAEQYCYRFEYERFYNTSNTITYAADYAGEVCPGTFEFDFIRGTREWGAWTCASYCLSETVACQ
jgi:hypothetical protein